jgi:uncharacterized membrane protein
MSKQRAIFFLGIWVAILPFLGFPGSWKRILILISGAVIAYLGYLLNKQMSLAARPTADRSAFVENKERHNDGAIL